MTEEDIIKLARQAGGIDLTNHGWTTWVGTQSTDFLVRFATLAAALKEPDIATMLGQFAAKQKPLDADMAAILHANLDSLYITDEPAAAPPEPSAKREPATDEQVTGAYAENASHLLSRWDHYYEAWRAAERYHGITREDKT